MTTVADAMLAGAWRGIPVGSFSAAVFPRASRFVGGSSKLSPAEEITVYRRVVGYMMLRTCSISLVLLTSGPVAVSVVSSPYPSDSMLSMIG